MSVIDFWSHCGTAPVLIRLQQLSLSGSSLQRASDLFFLYCSSCLSSLRSYIVTLHLLNQSFSFLQWSPLMDNLKPKKPKKLTHVSCWVLLVRGDKSVPS